MKKQLCILAIIFALLFTVIMRQEVSATELSETESTQDTESESIETTMPTREEIPYEVVNNKETKAWEIQAENLFVSVVKDRQLSITVSGLEVPEEYQIHPYEMDQAYENDFEAFITIISDGREFWIWSEPNLSFAINEQMDEQYFSNEFDIDYLTYCKDHGIMPVPYEISMTLEDMKSGLYTHKSNGYFYKVEEVEKIEHTQDSITWHVRIPTAYNFDVKKLDQIQVRITGEKSRHYVLSAEVK